MKNGSVVGTHFISYHLCNCGRCKNSMRRWAQVLQMRIHVPCTHTHTKQFTKWWIEVKIEIIMHPHEMWWASTTVTAYAFVYCMHCIVENRMWKMATWWYYCDAWHAYSMMHSASHSASVGGMQMIRINTKRMNENMMANDWKLPH